MEMSILQIIHALRLSAVKIFLTRQRQEILTIARSRCKVTRPEKISCISMSILLGWQYSKGPHTFAA